jgi:hypothetical protein
MAVEPSTALRQVSLIYKNEHGNLHCYENARSVMTIFPPVAECRDRCPPPSTREGPRETGLAVGTPVVVGGGIAS